MLGGMKSLAGLGYLAGLLNLATGILYRAWTAGLIGSYLDWDTRLKTGRLHGVTYKHFN